MSNILGTYNTNNKITVKETEDLNQNFPIVFVKNKTSTPQNPLIDGTPDELFYNPSTKTLHADNFSGGIPSLIEGEAIKLLTANNSTTIDVNFSKNTDIINALSDSDTILISNTSNQLKTIRGDKLKEDIRLTGGTNLSYGTGINSNTLNLDTVISNTTLSTNCS